MSGLRVGLVGMMAIVSAACGGSVSVPDPELVTNGCTVVAPEVLARQDPSDELVVVRVEASEGCGAPGQWIYGRSVEERDGRRFFLGFTRTATSRCEMWQSTPPTARFGVVRTRQTAALFTPTDTCLAFEGSAVSSDQSTAGVALFGSLEDAEAFRSFSTREASRREVFAASVR